MIPPTFPRRLASIVGLSLLMAAVLLPTTPQPACAEPQVVVVEGDYLGENGLPNQPKSKACFQAVVRMLKEAHVAFTATRDSEVEHRGLPAASVAILPYSRAMTDAEAEHFRRFVADGGKLVVFFTAHGVVLELLGLRAAGLARTDPKTPVARLHMRDKLAGAPGNIPWAPGQIALVEPLSGAHLLAVWQSSDGATTAFPAAFTHDHGVFFTADPRSLVSSGVLRAVIGHLAPATWQGMLLTDARQVGPLGRYASLAELNAYVTQQAQANRAFADALIEVQAAETVLAEIRATAEAGDTAGALALEPRARQAAERAFWASYPSIPGELRGVWMCNYAEPSWPAAMESLKQANFNAVFPYMMSGGVAFYPSKVLSVHPAVRGKTDSLAKAVAAAHAVGMPLHARMLNLTTLFAPREVVSSLRRNGRLMVTASGDSSDWLCPTNPTNRQAQVASALEMAAYGIAGIQFDYLRYPWKDVCFCARCRAKFERDCNVTLSRWPQDCTEGAYRGRFADWRREQVTSLAGEISSAVRARYPRMYISAAVFLNWESHRESFGQDWVAWIDRGIVDFVCPMDYTPEMERFQLYVSRQEKWIAGKIPWAAGLGVNADSMKYGGAHMAVEQIRVAREHGSQGFVIFNYSPQLVNDYLPWLSLGVTKTPTEFACPVGGKPQP